MSWLVSFLQSPSLSLPIRARINYDAIALYNRAVDEASAGRFEESANLTGQALAIQPNFTLALITRTSVLLELGRIDQAEQALNRAIALDPENPSVLASAASVRLKTGDFQEAIRNADKALEKDPTLIEAWVIKGTAHGETGEYSEEESSSQKALALDPNNTLAMDNLQYAQGHLQGTKKRETPMEGILVLYALGCQGLWIIFRDTRERSE